MAQLGLAILLMKYGATTEQAVDLAFNDEFFYSIMCAPADAKN